MLRKDCLTYGTLLALDDNAALKIARPERRCCSGANGETGGARAGRAHVLGPRSDGHDLGLWAPTKIAAGMRVGPHLREKQAWGRGSPLLRKHASLT